MACQGERLSNATIERIRSDFVKTIRVGGISITYKKMDDIVSWGSGASGVSGVEVDPVYSQPAYPQSTLSEGKSYTEYTVMAMVQYNPTIYQLRKLGIHKDSQIAATVAALTLEGISLTPRGDKDRMVIGGEAFDITSIAKSHLAEGTSGAVKNLVWVLGGIKRDGRI